MIDADDFQEKLRNAWKSSDEDQDREFIKLMNMIASAIQIFKNGSDITEQGWDDITEMVRSIQAIVHTKTEILHTFVQLISELSVQHAIQHGKPPRRRTDR
jgi:hypothetical protein